MLESTSTLLRSATAEAYAVGAFNVYNVEGVMAVIAAAESESSPVMLQLHPASIAYGGEPLIALCLAAATQAKVPVSVHLDHCNEPNSIETALSAGLTSIMADGSEHDFAGNLTFTSEIARRVHARGGFVEAELGRLAGTEDDLTVPENLARLTDPDQASRFVTKSRVDALAVCIGNAHGRYATEPRLDFQRLQAIRERVSVPLVLHGASGIPEDMVKRAIQLGICKLNVNTEVRNAYLRSLKGDLEPDRSPDLTRLMGNAVDAMKTVVAEKIRFFGSAGKA
jgi:tagatose 1,6-diphosphate aldolase GatY/KbaY